MNTETEQSIVDKIESIEEKRKARSLTFALFVCMALISSVAIFYAPSISEAFADRYDDSSDIALRAFWVRGLAIIPLVLFAAYVTLLYLEGGITTLKKSEGKSESVSDTQSLTLIAQSLEDSAKVISSNRTLSDADAMVVMENIGKVIENSLTVSFLEKIERKYGRSIQHGFVAAGFDDLFQRTKNRLGDFKGELSRKANINLLAGLIIGAVGLIVLIIFITNSQSLKDYEDVDRYFYYISRLALVAIIESVALFFLRQYQQALADEKFVANEITNVELKDDKKKNI